MSVTLTSRIPTNPQICVWPTRCSLGPVMSFDSTITVASHWSLAHTACWSNRFLSVCLSRFCEKKKIRLYSVWYFSTRERHFYCFLYIESNVSYATINVKSRSSLTRGGRLRLRDSKYSDLTWKLLVVWKAQERWWLTRGGHNRRFDCSYVYGQEITLLQNIQVFRQFWNMIKYACSCKPVKLIVNLYDRIPYYSYSKRYAAAMPNLN